MRQNMWEVWLVGQAVARGAAFSSKLLAFQKATSGGIDAGLTSDWSVQHFGEFLQKVLIHPRGTHTTVQPGRRWLRKR